MQGLLPYTKFTYFKLYEVTWRFDSREWQILVNNLHLAECSDCTAHLNHNTSMNFVPITFSPSWRWEGICGLRPSSSPVLSSNFCFILHVVLSHVFTPHIALANLDKCMFAFFWLTQGQAVKQHVDLQADVAGWSSTKATLQFPFCSEFREVQPSF